MGYTRGSLTPIFGKSRIALRLRGLAVSLVAVFAAIGAIACGDAGDGQSSAGQGGAGQVESASVIIPTATPTLAQMPQPVVARSSAPVEGAKGDEEEAPAGGGQARASKQGQAAAQAASQRAAGRAGVDTRRYRQAGFAGAGDVAPFRNIAPQALGDEASVANDLPGVVIFDYDRDGDMDFYITQSMGNPNLLFRNEGGGDTPAFSEVGVQAGADATASNSTGVVACDVNNDGYQDLYVSAQGIVGDGKDFQAAAEDAELRAAISDRLLLNNADGGFTDITAAAFGDAANTRTGTSPACADIDRDGWIDIFVGNRSDLDNVHPGAPTFGNLNVLYRNNGDLTFSEIGAEAGVRGEQVVTWATMFFDYDDDGDPDLWTADDGGPVRVYRNDTDDTEDGAPRFTAVERAMGLETRGNWMGFALGDYDGDVDLDVFVTNIGYHPKTRPLALSGASGDCSVEQRFELSTCAHYLLSNGGTRWVSSFGEVGFFPDVAAALPIEPSRVMPPDSIDPAKITLDWRVPTGLAAYDFGFGAAFFDYENDGDADLYWTGSALGRGESPDGMIFPAAGRMLRGNGQGEFQDITVEARLLNIKEVDYGLLDPADAAFDRAAQRIDTAYHENGKGLAKGDLNGDGYVDLIATNSAGSAFVGAGDELGYEEGPTFVWLSGGGANNRLTLRLRGRQAVDGTGSNADAIGARAFVTARIGGERRTQIGEALGSSSFLSMSSLDLHFGLGDAAVVDEITIFWPSGIRQVIVDAPVNQVLEVTEPALPR